MSGGSGGTTHSCLGIVYILGSKSIINTTIEKNVGNNKLLAAAAAAARVNKYDDGLMVCCFKLYKIYLLVIDYYHLLSIIHRFLAVEQQQSSNTMVHIRFITTAYYAWLVLIMVIGTLLDPAIYQKLMILM